MALHRSHPFHDQLAELELAVLRHSFFTGSFIRAQNFIDLMSTIIPEIA